VLGGIVTNLRPGHPRNRGSIAGRVTGLSLLQSVQTSSGAHPSSDEGQSKKDVSGGNNSALYQDVSCQRFRVDFLRHTSHIPKSCLKLRVCFLPDTPSLVFTNYPIIQRSVVFRRATSNKINNEKYPK
jgi:hypothetical protein